MTDSSSLVLLAFALLSAIEGVPQPPAEIQIARIGRGAAGAVLLGPPETPAEVAACYEEKVKKSQADFTGSQVCPLECESCGLRTPGDCPPGLPPACSSMTAFCGCWGVVLHAAKAAAESCCTGLVGPALLTCQMVKIMLPEMAPSIYAGNCTEGASEAAMIAERSAGDALSDAAAEDLPPPSALQRIARIGRGAAGAELLGMPTFLVCTKELMMTAAHGFHQCQNGNTSKSSYCGCFGIAFQGLESIKSCCTGLTGMDNMLCQMEVLQLTQAMNALHTKHCTSGASEAVTISEHSTGDVVSDIVAEIAPPSLDLQQISSMGSSTDIADLLGSSGSIDSCIDERIETSAASYNGSAWCPAECAHCHATTPGGCPSQCRNATVFCGCSGVMFQALEAATSCCTGLSGFLVLVCDMKIAELSAAANGLHDKLCQAGANDAAALLEHSTGSILSDARAKALLLPHSLQQATGNARGDAMAVSSGMPTWLVCTKGIMMTSEYGVHQCQNGNTSKSSYCGCFRIAFHGLDSIPTCCAGLTGEDNKLCQTEVLQLTQATIALATKHCRSGASGDFVAEIAPPSLDLQQISSMGSSTDIADLLGSSGSIDSCIQEKIDMSTDSYNGSAWCPAECAHCHATTPGGCPSQCRNATVFCGCSGVMFQALEAAKSCCTGLSGLLFLVCEIKISELDAAANGLHYRLCQAGANDAAALLEHSTGSILSDARATALLLPNSLQQAASNARGDATAVISGSSGSIESCIQEKIETSTASYNGSAWCPAECAHCHATTPGGCPSQCRNVTVFCGCSGVMFQALEATKSCCTGLSGLILLVCEMKISELEAAANGLHYKLCQAGANDAAALLEHSTGSILSDARAKALLLPNSMQQVAGNAHGANMAFTPGTPSGIQSCMSERISTSTASYNGSAWCPAECAQCHATTADGCPSQCRTATVFCGCSGVMFQALESARSCCTGLSGILYLMCEVEILQLDAAANGLHSKLCHANGASTGNAMSDAMAKALPSPQALQQIASSAHGDVQADIPGTPWGIMDCISDRISASTASYNGSAWCPAECAQCHATTPGGCPSQCKTVTVFCGCSGVMFQALEAGRSCCSGLTGIPFLMCEAKILELDLAAHGLHSKLCHPNSAASTGDVLSDAMAKALPPPQVAAEEPMAEEWDGPEDPPPQALVQVAAGAGRAERAAACAGMLRGLEREHAERAERRGAARAAPDLGAAAAQMAARAARVLGGAAPPALPGALRRALEGAWTAEGPGMDAEDVCEVILQHHDSP